MTVYGVIFAAIARKVKTLISEYRALVVAAAIVEQKIVVEAKNQIVAANELAVAEAERLAAEAKAVLDESEANEAAILRSVKFSTTRLKNELIDKIAKL